MESEEKASGKITKYIGSDKLEIVPLGGGNEVGRSCIMLKFKGKLIMLDCGIHPASNDISALPFFDLVDPAEIDLLLVTHFHLDHCGAVPYLTEKTPFKAPIFMTYPTKAIYKHVLGDSLKVYDGDKVLFDSQDILNSLDKISVVNFHQEVEVDGIKFICYAAGHVLGACMFLIDIAGTKILYTGDYSREEDRHIKGAEIPQTKVDVLIVESTYGIKTHDPREIREKRFIETVRNIVVDRNGHCLLPVFVLGRAQEILLILEEYWNRKPEMQNIPIYYASTLMAKCMIIFQTYINMMGDAIKESFKRGINPFNFKNISILKNIDNLDNNQPSVVMASPGMLQKGLSRTLFEKWCSCAQNGVVFTGYCVESTLAREILSGRKEIRRADGIDVPIKMSVHNISFSAHADFVQTRDFIKTVDPTQVILVHGESHEADRMKKDLEVIFPEKQFFVPKNWQIVEIEIESKIMCKVEGKLITKLEEKLQQIIEKKKKELDGFKGLSLKPHKARRKASHDKKRSDSVEREGRNSSSESRERSASKDKSKLKVSRKGSTDEFRMTEDKSKHPRSTHSHSGDEEFDESLYIDVPVEAFLLKKNFDYILIDKEDIVEYTGKSETKINQVLKVPYHGTMQLVSHFISQMYADSRLDMKSDEEAVVINEEIFITKNDLENMLVFRWAASQKNDIIADCLAYLFSQFPENRDFDIFNIDPPKEAKEVEMESLQKKVVKRIVNTFHGYTYRVDRQYVIFKDAHAQFTINLKTGKVESKDEAVAQRARSIIANLF